MNADDNRGSGPVAIKKVAAYPISVNIFKAEGQPPIKGQIWKLTDFGFLMKVDSSHYFKVAEEFFAQFELPALHRDLKSPCKVIKTYDVMEHLSRSQKIKLLTVEMHFLRLTEEQKRWIVAYLERSGQTQDLGKNSSKK